MQPPPTWGELNFFEKYLLGRESEIFNFGGEGSCIFGGSNFIGARGQEILKGNLKLQLPSLNKHLGLLDLLYLFRFFSFLLLLLLTVMFDEVCALG